MTKDNNQLFYRADGALVDVKSRKLKKHDLPTPLSLKDATPLTLSQKRSKLQAFADRLAADLENQALAKAAIHASEAGRRMDLKRPASSRRSLSREALLWFVKNFTTKKS